MRLEKFTKYFGRVGRVVALLAIVLPAFAQDPHAPSGLMPQGRNKGRPIEVDKQRSFKIIEQTLDKDGGVYRIANIAHGYRFYIGTIDLKNIERLVFQMEYFPPEWIAAHTQVRVDFKPDSPVQLTDQICGADCPQITAKSLVFSNEAVPVVGGPRYSLQKSIAPNFALAYRLLTLETKVAHQVGSEGNRVDQWEIILQSDKTRAGLVAQFLRDFHDPSMTQVYHLLKRNCTNTLFESIDRYLSNPRDWGDRFQTMMPIWSRHALRGRNLIHREKLEPLEKEFANALSTEEVFGKRPETHRSSEIK